MSIEFFELPYSADALSPFLSRETVETHHGAHHHGYVKKLNKQISGTALDDRSLNEIIVQTHADGDSGVFNNAAQVLNHNLLWQSMSPDGGGEPTGPLREALNTAFGNIDGFYKAFKDAATSQFGSGWAWLVHDAGKIRVINSGNADTPAVHGLQPLLTLDVWEHAYYLDYKSDRGRYVDMFLSDCINWSFAATNLAELAAGE